MGKRCHWIVCLERSLGQDIREVGLVWPHACVSAVCHGLRGAEGGVNIEDGAGEESAAGRHGG